MPALAASAATPSATALVVCFELRIDFGGVVAEVADGGVAGGHGEGVAAERAGLVDGAERGELIHELALAAEGSAWEAAADDFAEGDEVGVEVVEFERAAEGEAEAGHDFVDDEQGAVVVGEFAQAAEIAGMRAGCSRRCRRRVRG